MSSLWRNFLSALGRKPKPEQPVEEDSLLTDFGSLRPVQRVSPMTRVHSITGAVVTYQNQPLEVPRPWIRPQLVLPPS